MTVSVSIQDASRSFDGVTALDAVSLDVRAGERFVLLGPSGCGKTTLLRSVAGLETLDAGSVALGDRIVSGNGAWTPPAERGLGFVFQDLALWPHLTVRQHLEFVLGGVAKTSEGAARIDAVLEDLHITDLRDRRPEAVSGGQAQRLALARELVREPGLLLLDEPLSSLDPAVAREIRELLRDLGERRGMTMVYVTHLQEEAFELADRIGVMRDGRLEQTGTPEEIYERPATAFVASFVGSCALVDGDLDATSGRFRCALGDFTVPEECRGGQPRMVVRERDFTLQQGGEGEVLSSLYGGATFRHQVRVGGIECRVVDETRRGVGERVTLVPRRDPWFVSE